MIVTDLDGTLLDSASALSAACRRALLAIGSAGRLRVIATGRNLYSAETVIDPAFPIDYLAFSSGYSIVDWHTKELLVTHPLPTDLACAVATFLDTLGLPYMMHAPAPHNHHFVYRRTHADNPDWERRLARYQRFATPLPNTLTPQQLPWCEISQLLVIEARDKATCVQPLVERFPEISVVTATSPLDHRSVWVEIFNRGVGKSFAAKWLQQRHGIEHRLIGAVGNDYNDTDLLDWSVHAFVVANAPADLRRRYQNVPSNDADGFAVAAARWRQATAVTAIPASPPLPGSETDRR